MPQVKGRDLQEPVASIGFTGRGVLLRIDDNRRPEFWLAIELSTDELRRLIDQWESWMMTETQEWPALPTEERAG